MSADVVLDDEALAQLREGMARFRQARYGFEQRRAHLDAGCGYNEEAWREYARLGWLGLGLTADEGGFGDDPRPLAALMDYAGAALALEPVLGSAVLCGRLLARLPGDAAAALRAQLAAGAIFAPAHAESVDDPAPAEVATALRDGALHGRKLMVLHGDAAADLIVSARDSASGALALVHLRADAPGVSRDSFRLLDGRGAANLVFAGARPMVIAQGGAAQAALEGALDDARLALCAETLAVVRSLNAQTLEHLKTRKQFGRPIGANQVLQHRMGELVILAEELAAVIEAAWDTRADTPDRLRAVAAAAAYAATVGRQVAHEAVQMHGGMGMTAELPVSHGFKRLMVNARLPGNRQALLRRFAAAPSALASSAASAR